VGGERIPLQAGGLSPSTNRRIGRAMSDYDMLANGDRVLVAVSGGLDSQVLAWLLRLWLHKAPICYRLFAVHVDMVPQGKDTSARASHVGRFLSDLGYEYAILPTDNPPPATSNTKDLCFQCARNRRRQLFDYAGEHRFNRIAFGHHSDDLVETFLLNIFYSGNISTMVPKQELFSGSLSLIRPMAYLAKEEIAEIADRLGFSAIPSGCPLAEETRRLEVRRLLADMEQKNPGVRKRVFASLGNVRQDYLLKPQQGEHET
jgi:tRNA 2-thiocytidine biosynthesis protein TtcA